MNVTVQDYPGRTKRGLWRIGVPPSGPIDHLSMRLANSLVGNTDGAAALEVTVKGPVLKFHTDTVVAVAGAPFVVLLNGSRIPMFQAIPVRLGDVLDVSSLDSNVGARCYIAVNGAFDVPDYLGSKSTFVNGNFGGHQGRALRSGDVVALGAASHAIAGTIVPKALLPRYTNAWRISVLPGPMANPDFMLDSDIEMLMSTEWKVHHNSNRLGIRLMGPAPTWTRKDGGEGGSHPSNIHDCEYAIGTINFTGDMSGARFPTESYTRDAIGSHACSLEANMCVTNGIPLGCLLFLPVHTVNRVQTLKADHPCKRRTILGRLRVSHHHHQSRYLEDWTTESRRHRAF
jgi:urea carboxylase